MVADINTLVNLQEAFIQQVTLPLAAEKKISIHVLRIDTIHPVISGNKWFKLKYALQEATALHKKSVVTFGGAWSNHLLATAYACNRLGLEAIGIIRGEKPPIPSPTLEDCSRLGMQLHYISRELYKQPTDAQAMARELFPNAWYIEEGGRSKAGVKGAGEIMDLVSENNYSHICCAAGTGTMMAGLVNRADIHQHIAGICVLKLPAHENSIEKFIHSSTGDNKNYSLYYNYHFGGYAKKTPQLIEFMNDFYRQTGIPLDVVYTAKLLYAVLNLAAQDSFPAGSRLLIIHSGGLQGNRSLPKNTLIF